MAQRGDPSLDMLEEFEDTKEVVRIHKSKKKDKKLIAK
jgi:hypothetical protein